VDIRRNVRALADGYVTMQALTIGDRALQARAAMSFIVTSDITIVGVFSQNGFNAIKPGAAVKLVFDNDPAVCTTRNHRNPREHRRRGVNARIDALRDPRSRSWPH